LDKFNSRKYLDICQVLGVRPGKNLYTYLLRMTFDINIALQLVNLLTAEELCTLSRDSLLIIAGKLTSSEFREFTFVKNIKIFGGINGYVNDFLSTGTINKIRDMPDDLSKIRIKEGAIETLNKMLTYSDLTEQNCMQINSSILLLSHTPATAGGSRKTKRDHLN
jgi:hypothetical protein